MGGSFCPCTHFDNRAAKLYLVDSQLDTRLAIVHRKKEECPFFFFFFLPLFLRLKVAEDDKQQSNIYLGAEGTFFFPSRPWIRHQPNIRRLPLRTRFASSFLSSWKTLDDKKFRSTKVAKQDYHESKSSKPSLLKREREWVAQRAITLTNFEPRFLFSCKYIISTIKLRRSKGNRNR